MKFSVCTCKIPAKEVALLNCVRPNIPMLTGIRKMISCNHIRSYQYFTESINPGICYFIGTECGSWEEFQNGSCFSCSTGNKCPFQTKFGMHADLYLRKGEAYGSSLRLPPPRSNVKLFMMTGVERPFCRKTFQYCLQI